MKDLALSRRRRVSAEGVRLCAACVFLLFAFSWLGAQEEVLPPPIPPEVPVAVPVADVMDPADFPWEMTVVLGGELYPSTLYSTATVDFMKLEGAMEMLSVFAGVTSPEQVLGRPGPGLFVSLVAPEDNARVRLEIRSANFIRPSVFEGKLPSKGVRYVVFPQLDYDYNALVQVREPMPEMIHAHLILDGKDRGRRQATVNVRSVRDCPLFLRTPDGQKLVVANQLFAAYVNENHPMVNKILKEALSLEIVDEFNGSRGSAEQVKQEMFAIWSALRKRGIRYSNLTGASSESSMIVAQNIRPFEESLESAQANCVDGSVLFASIFRKLDLGTALIILPGHCLVMVVVREEGKEDPVVFALETTMLGAKPKDEKTGKPATPRQIFEYSLAMGEKELNDIVSAMSAEEQSKIGDVKLGRAVLESAEAAQSSKRLRIIPINAARAIGVIPLKSSP
jgi:hypothetical protein